MNTVPMWLCVALLVIEVVFMLDLVLKTKKCVGGLSHG